MKNYKELGHKILTEGHVESTRLGVDTLALHNQVLSFNSLDGFPLLTTKHVGFRSILTETLWYLKGTTNIKYLESNKVFVWTKFATPEGDIGKTYSYQFRNFGGVDQVKDTIARLNTADGTTDRRAIINLYNVADLKEMSIPPCIAMIQFHKYWVNGIAFLDTSVYQRSADFCLGVPYDIAEMALLSEIIAAYTDSTFINMSIFYGNVHIYKPHVEELKKQLENPELPLPSLIIDREAIKASEPEKLLKSFFALTNVPDRPKHNYELF